MLEQTVIHLPLWLNTAQMGKMSTRRNPCNWTYCCHPRSCYNSNFEFLFLRGMHMMPFHRLPFFFVCVCFGVVKLCFIPHHNMTDEVVPFSPTPCQKFQRNVLALLLVWSCQLQQGLLCTHLSVAQLTNILHTFASPVSSWSDSCFKVMCVSATIMSFSSGICLC